MITTWRAASFAAIGVVAAGTLLLASGRRDTFPHERHQRLFPLCVACHAGIPVGDERTYYPEPAACAECHDRTVAAAVEWDEPTREPSNLRFAHARHADVLAAADAEDLDCSTCHTEVGAPRMQVRPPVPARCFDCHTHAATEHFVDAACVQCHVPLVESALPSARLSTLPVPSTHARDDFLSPLHGELAAANPPTCATCHAREQCLGCHVAIEPGSPAERVPAAEGRMVVPALAARYPTPASHRDPDWERRHGQVASRQACATCHTRESCQTCHGASTPATVASLPSARNAVAPGVAVSRRVPPSHASPFFATGHGSAARARPQTCATCHDRVNFCGACHEPAAAATRNAEHMQAAVAPTQPAPARPRAARAFHPSNYVLRHSAEAYGRRIDCASCHNVQRFCRDCHESVGRGSTGRLGPGYHDAEPVWLLRHGQAARQTLESCTTCHTQRDCMQCHSQFGAFRVSPHGPDFDARRAQRANPQICRACHLGDPLPVP